MKKHRFSTYEYGARQNRAAARKRGDSNEDIHLYRLIKYYRLKGLSAAVN